MKIGDRVWVFGYIDEIRKDVVIIRNDSGYFGTERKNVFVVETVKEMEEKRALVHCKDCAWRYFSRASGEHYCFEFNVPVTDTDFCSKAERKEEC